MLYLVSYSHHQIRLWHRLEANPKVSPTPSVALLRRCGRGGGIRTPDILLPKQARYQTALHPEDAGFTLARRAVYPQCQYWAMSQKNTSSVRQTL